MPTYNFLNNETGEEFEAFMKISENQSKHTIGDYRTSDCNGRVYIKAEPSA